MKVSIIGTGYVGLVTGACLADVGNHVLCLDVDPKKIERLKRGEIPIFEPGLEAIVRNNVAAGRLAFTNDPKESALYAKVHEIVVDDAPWLFVAHDLNPRAMSSRVKGFVPPQSWFVDLTSVSLVR